MAIRVLIVDDSATARAVLRDILESDNSIEVVATASETASMHWKNWVKKFRR